MQVVRLAARWAGTAFWVLARYVKLSCLLALELGAFPVACGLWLDICALPLGHGSMERRIAGIASAPLLSAIVHWILGIGFILALSFVFAVLREVGGREGRRWRWRRRRPGTCAGCKSGHSCWGAVCVLCLYLVSRGWVDAVQSQPPTPPPTHIRAAHTCCCAPLQVLRPGALPFLRDLTNPERNPIRELMDGPLPVYARRMCLAGMVYAVLMVVHIHLPILLARALLPGLFPLRWGHAGGGWCCAHWCTVM